MATMDTPALAPVQGHLKRSVGFWGLLFMSLGSIIGSGWLLGALNAARSAGPASILSWILAAGMLSTLALVFAELGAAYPVTGGGGRFPYYSHGPIAGLYFAARCPCPQIQREMLEVKSSSQSEAYHELHFSPLYCASRSCFVGM